MVQHLTTFHTNIFCLQACRGLELDRGISVDETDAARDESDSNFERNRKIPIEADIMVVYAVRSGKLLYSLAVLHTREFQMLTDRM